MVRSFIELAYGGKLKYYSNLLQNFNPKNVGNVLNYHGFL